MAPPLGFRHSKKTREKMRLIHLRLGTRPPSFLGKRHNKETLLKMSTAQSKRKRSKKELQYLRDRNKTMWTLKLRKKVSEIHKKMPMTEERKKALAITHQKSRGQKRTIQQLRNLSNSLKGNKSSFWKGGRSKRHEKIRASFKYRNWRTKIFIRDDFTCVSCKKRGVFLEADHIKPFSLFPSLRFNLSNGRTLCRKCHRKTETFGYKIKKCLKKTSI